VIPAENPPLAIRRNAEDLDHAWHFETKKTVWSVRNSLATPHETSILHVREKIVYHNAYGERSRAPKVPGMRYIGAEV
jgi:hypothetical protein